MKVVLDQLALHRLDNVRIHTVQILVYKYSTPKQNSTNYLLYSLINHNVLCFVAVMYIDVVQYKANYEKKSPNIYKLCHYVVHIYWWIRRTL